MNNEDWWRLVYENGKLFVEHEQDHCDVRGGGDTSKATTTFEIEVFQRHANVSDTAKAKLAELLNEMFNSPG